MINQFFKTFVVLLCFFTQWILAQDHTEKDYSDGQLIVNSTSQPVKIYTTTDYGTFNTFSTLPDGALVILNNDNFPIENGANGYNMGLLNDFESAKFQFLTKDFKPLSQPISIEQVGEAKYLLKNTTALNGTESVKLETPFTIWDPSSGIALGSFTLHFYSLMFVLAFGLGYVVMSKMFKIDHVNDKYLEPLFTWTLVGTILGARLGHVIFYQPELFKEDFWSVFLPIQTKPEFKFTGFAGLASHGASIMLILTTLYYSIKIIKKNPLWVYDRLGIVVALGGGFVRIGNFFNSEIIGKATAEGNPFAFLFPQMSKEYGLTIPRFPTQLFEATGYFLLFILLWVLYRYTNKKYQQGWLFGLFFLILWSIRFFVEFLKMPQGDEMISFAGLNTGQILSLPFIIIGAVTMLISKRFKISEEENQKLD